MKNYKWLIIYGCWTLLAAFYATQQTLQNVFNNINVSGQWLTAFKFEFISANNWFFLTPLILWLSRRFSIESQKLPFGLVQHLFFGVAVIFIKIGMDAFLFPLFGMNFGDQALSYYHIFKAVGVYSFHLYLPTYFAVVAVAHAVNYQIQVRERERITWQLETELVNARLLALKTQLRPHFLFNTLQGISTLMYRDVKLADRMLNRLGNLLRATLEEEGKQEVPLKKELELLELYLEIEKMRLANRLTLVFDVAPETLDALVPNMILQPLVENAVRHGIAPLLQGGTITIGAHRRDGKLELSVGDNGTGISVADGKELREGIGLTNTRARLAHLYGDAYQMEITGLPKKGLQINLTLPFRPDY